MKTISLFLMLSGFSAAASAAAAPVSDFYKIIGVFPGASSDEISQAYRRVKKRLRSGSHTLESKERLEEAEEARNTLQDPQARAEYDSRLKEAGFQEEPNFYKIIGVLSDSSAADITRAYREIRYRIHPDRNKGDPDATRRFQELQEAHKVLSDPRLRLRHDRALRVLEGNLLESPAPEPSAGKPEQDLKMRTAEGETATDGFQKTAARLEQEESLETEVFNEQIFQLAKELEAAGGEENTQEAVDWYRTLAADGHIEAARRLAPLLEDIDMEEALYRYRQGAADGSDRKFSRVALFREAQLYLKGVYKGDEPVILKDPSKAAALFERAVGSGASPAAVAKEYELVRDYDKAMEWRLKGQGEPAQSLLEKQEGGNAPAAPVQTEKRADTPVHQAILMDYENASRAAIQKSIVRMLGAFEMSAVREIYWFDLKFPVFPGLKPGFWHEKLPYLLN